MDNKIYQNYIEPLVADLKSLQYVLDRGVLTHYQVAEIAPDGLIEALYAADYALQQERDHKSKDFTQDEMDLMIKGE